MTKSYTKKDEENYNRWINNMQGVWFASSLPDMEDWAEDKVKEGKLKPLSSLVPNKEMAKGWYVPFSWEVKDLTKYFSYWAINQFGIFELNLNYQI